MRTIVGKVINGRMTTMTHTGQGTSKYVGKEVEVAPVTPPDTALDIPHFMVRINPVTKPRVKSNTQSFADILKIAMQYE